MKRNLKALGAVLVAVFATAAVLASGAQAQIKVTVGASPAWLTGELIEHPVIGKTERLTLAGGQDVTCEEVKTTATVQSGSTSITVVPEYKKCEAVIGTERHLATVTMNDCDYLYHGGVEVAGGTTFKEVDVDLTCPTGKEVEIHVYKKTTDEIEELCTYKIAPFVNNKGVETHNVASASNDVTMTTTMSGVPVTRTGSLLCGPTPTTGTLTGSTTIKAFEDKGGSISNGTVGELVEGGQVSLTISK